MNEIMGQQEAPAVDPQQSAPPGQPPAAPGKGMAPADAEAAQKVVLGCLKIMFDKATHQNLVQSMRGSAPLPTKLAATAVGVMKLFAGRVKGEIPRQVLIPAAVMLVMEVAKFAAEAGLAKPTGADVKAAIAAVPNLVKQAFPAKGAQPQQPAAPAAAPAAPAAPAAMPPPQGGLVANQMGA